MKKLGNLFEKFLDRPSSDWALAIVAALACILLNLNTLLSEVPVENQRSAYSAGASVSGTVAGFVVASTYFFAGVDNKVANQLRRQRGPLLNRTMIGAFLTLALCASVMVGAVLATPAPAPLPAPPGTPLNEVASNLFIPASILSVLKMFRVAAISWGMLASQYENSRNTPDP